MAIRNSDGSVFRLASPNPIMKQQNLWDRSSLRLHNCRWAYKPFHAAEEARVVPRPVPKQPPAPEPPVTQYNNPPSPLDIPVPVQDTRIIETGKADALADIPKVTIHCLPMIKVEHLDQTYGQKHWTKTPGKKFAFEAVMLEEQDLAIRFWTTCKEVSLESTIYPMNKSKRWWKVVEREPKTGGFLITAMITDFNPSFAD